MTWLDKLLRMLARFRVYFIVRPWERAIRVRAGRWVREYGPGIYFQLPLLDQSFVQSVRVRVLSLPAQTFGAGGRTTTVRAAVHWRIVDVRRVYETIAYPVNWIFATALAAIARCGPDAAPSDYEAAALAAFAEGGAADRHGLAVDAVRVTDSSSVRTYRLITDSDAHEWDWDRMGSLESAPE